VLGSANRELDAEVTDRQNRLARTEKRIHGLVEFIATGDRSECVVSTLRDLEEQAKTEKEALSSLERRTREPVALPSANHLVGSVLDIEAALAEDPIIGRKRLRALFRDAGWISSSTATATSPRALCSR
jgi:hypothetical protein